MSVQQLYAVAPVDVSRTLDVYSGAVVTVRGIHSQDGGERTFERLGIVVRDGTMVVVWGMSKEARKLTASLADNEEIPLSSVLRDDDLNLSFLTIDKPKEAGGESLSSICLETARESVRVGEPVAVLGRTAGLRYEASVESSQVVGVFDRPRRLYGVQSGSGYGAVFDASNRFVGLAVPWGRDLGWRCGTVMLVVTPAEDIRRFVKQAAEKGGLKPLTAESSSVETKGEEPSTGKLDSPLPRVMDRYADAVVRISAVVSVDVQSAMGGMPNQEQSIEVGGLIVDESGLVITDLNSIDPSARVREMINQQMKRLPEEVREQVGEIKIDLDVSDLKVLLADGAELEGELTSKDEQSGIAVITIKDLGERRLVGVDVRKTAPTPGLFDEVVLLGRSGKKLHRQVIARLGRVDSIKGGARLRMTVRGSSCSDVVFSTDGKFIGLSVHQVTMTEFAAAMEHGIVHSRDIARIVYGAKGAKNRDKPARADTVAEKARALSQRLSDATVTVTASGTVGRQNREVEQVATGLVVDPGGVVLASLRELSHLGQTLVKDLKRVRVLTADGTELEAELFLKDNDLDVAFVRVKESELKDKKVSLTGLDLKPVASRVTPGQPLVFLSRKTNGKLRDEPLGMISRVVCVVDKPREIVATSVEELPAAVYTLDGSFVGFQLVSTYRCYSCDNDHHKGAVTPAADVLRLLK